MARYRQLTLDERYQIFTLIDLGFTQTAIAEKLSRSKSTISRELHRNRGVNGYDASQAQRLSNNRRKKAHKANKRHPILVEWVTALLKDKWSPEQIAGTASELGYSLVSNGVQAKHSKRLQLILGRLNASTSSEDMDLPGLFLHPLTGSRAEIWSVRVNGNWRITFRLKGENAEIVNYEDYH